MLPATISPSMMCADIFELRRIVDTFEAEGIEYLHLDVMDGEFVPNFCLGTDYCRRLRAGTDIPFDYHLMVTSPEKKISFFDLREGDTLAVHHESGGDIRAALAEVRARGVKAFIAINPDTPVETVLDYLSLIDGVLLMTVYPGFAGRQMTPDSPDRIRRLRALLDGAGLKDMTIEVDGNVNFEKAPIMRKAGADRFVVGTSSILGPGDTAEHVRRMRRLLNEADGTEI